MLLTPNLNGTSRERLIEERCDVSRVAQNLLQAMSNASPNARDYQLKPENFELDLREWNECATVVHAFWVKLAQEIEELQEQEDACRAS
jgi:hypothetical protein